MISHMAFIEMPKSFESYTPPNDNEVVMGEILAQEQLKPISFEPGGKVICEDEGGKKFFMKRCSDTERGFYTSVFPEIRLRQLPFATLQLPEFRNIVSRNQSFIFINYYEGNNYNSAWNEISSLGYGGRGIVPDFASRVVSVVKDFSMVDPKSLASFNLPMFSFDSWLQGNLPLISEALTRRDIVNDGHIERARELLDDSDLFSHSRIVLTNGDFYPRNLIDYPGNKVLVIDWEGRKDYVGDQRNVFFNYIENHIAFFFAHMWGNYAFQRRLLRDAAEKFNIRPRDMQAAVLIKSLEQCLIWPDDLARRQAETFVHALDIGFIDDLLRP